MLTARDGERYAYSPPLNGVGFFEDFFDSEENAVSLFWRAVNQRLSIAAEAISLFGDKTPESTLKFNVNKNRLAV